MQSVLIISALYAKRPNYVVLYMQSVLIMLYAMCPDCLVLYMQRVLIISALYAKRP